MIKYFMSMGLAILVLASCSQKTTPTSKEKEPYDGPQVSYSADVAPLIERSCAPCHFPQKQGKKDPLDTYGHMKSELATVLQRVQLKESDVKFMPYKKKKQSLSTEEIEMLKNWARGGFSE